MNTFELRTGDLAYLDTLFSGLVPCKVTRITEREDTRGLRVAEVDVRVTAPRKGYHAGEVIPHQRPGFVVVKREQVRRSRRFTGQYVIHGDTVAIPDTKEA